MSNPIRDSWTSPDGSVRLLCGDCRAILPTISGINAVVTDPPYGISFQSSMDGCMGICSVAGDDSTDVRDAVLSIITCPSLVFGKWNAPRPKSTRMVLTWDKGNHVGMGDLSLPWKPNTEEVYVIGSGFSGHRGGSVLRHLAVAGCVGLANTGRRHHPTEKPVALMRELVEKCPRGVICDPFMGSGTTGVACIRTGRRFVGIEIEPKYFAIAVERCQAELERFPLFEPHEPTKAQRQLLAE